MFHSHTNLESNKNQYLLENGKKYTILYVEDSSIARKSMKEILGLFFQDVRIAKDGLGGLELFKKFKPNIVITDINMPHKNGLELIRDIQNIDSQIAFIIITGFTENEYLLKALELGINKYLVKPIDKDKLVEVLYRSVYDLEFKHQFIRMQEEQELLKLTMDLSPVLTVLEKDSKIKYMNSSFLNFLGFNSYKDFSAENDSLFSIIYDEDSNKIFKYYEEYIANALSSERKYNKIYLKDKNGKFNIFQVTYRFYPNIDTLVSVYTDIESIEKSTKELIKLSEIDTLTNVYNRYKFDKYFKKMFDKAQDKKYNISLLMIDIDNLTKINSSYGNQFGDKVICSVANFLKSSLKDGDFLSRFSGGEFMLILKDKDSQKSYDYAQELRVAIFNNFNSKLTCSFGIAEFKLKDTKKDTLQRVNDAVLKAKKSGGDTVISSI